MRQLIRLTIKTQDQIRKFLERNGTLPFLSTSINLHLERNAVLATSYPVWYEHKKLRQFLHISEKRFDNTRRLLLEKRVRRKILNEVLEKQQQKLDHFHDALQERKHRLLKDVHERKEHLQEAFQEKKDHLQDVLYEKKEQLEEAEKRIKQRGKFIIDDIKKTKEIMRERVEEVVEKENIYTIPNLLCVTRILFSPYLGYLICTNNFEYALGFMIIAGISDFLDGWIARNFKSQSSNFGSFLDPMADKVLIGTLFLTLTYSNLIPVPLTALIIMRDVVLVTAGFVIRYKSLSPPRTLSRYFDATHATAQLAPTLISKINTGVQLGLVGTTLAAPVFSYVDHPALQALWYLTASTTILSAFSYLGSNNTYRYFRKP